MEREVSVETEQIESETVTFCDECGLSEYDVDEMHTFAKNPRVVWENTVAEIKRMADRDAPEWEFEQVLDIEWEAEYDVCGGCEDQYGDTEPLNKVFITPEETHSARPDDEDDDAGLFDWL